MYKRASSKKKPRAVAEASETKPHTAHHREDPQFDAMVKRLGQRIRAWRDAQGLTMAEAAEKMAVQQPHVSRLERGIGNPTLAVLLSIAQAMGTTVPELLAPDDD